jgi:5-oxoprolinase (ATP-hydrolysing) subunit C
MKTAGPFDDPAPVVEVVEAGAAVSVQDRGRVGHRALGVPLAGAADPVLMACANALLAQPADSAVLEVGLLGPVLRALHGPVRLALAGDFAPRISAPGGQPVAVAPWRSISLQPGEQLHLGPCRSGVGYVALAGGCRVPQVLGSRATYARAGLGGIEGRAPRAGDVLLCRAGSGPELQALQPWVHAAGPLRVLPGPQDDHFDAQAWALLVGSPYTVTHDADRMGVRLQGPLLTHRPGKGADIVSEAVVPGAVQVPGSGQPILLGVDAQTIGGYAKIATVISADVPRLAHLRPGAAVRFAVVTLDEARAARQAQAAAWAAWARRLQPVQAGVAPDEPALYTNNLISGIINAHLS